MQKQLNVYVSEFTNYFDNEFELAIQLDHFSDLVNTLPFI